jgi:hypothetical protein
MLCLLSHWELTLVSRSIGGTVLEYLVAWLQLRLLLFAADFCIHIDLGVATTWLVGLRALVYKNP